MTKRYRIGNPIPTGAVVTELVPAEGPLPYFTADPAAGTLALALNDEDIVYGLGETVRGINKRGFIYVNYNADNPHHTELSRSLYASQNFLICFRPGGKTFGVYFDTPGKITFDIGFTDYGNMLISFEDFDADVYIFEEDSLPGITAALRRLTGKSYVPPVWAFGFGQSRWGYRNADDVRAIADAYEKAGIPLDMIYLDIDYMEDYKDFTVSRERFPDFPAFVSEMKTRGIRLIPIIDAGVKAEPGYPVFDEGTEKGYFCKCEDGSDFIAAVWPGLVRLPDVLNDKARAWFGDCYAPLLDAGIEGFWNDMNEPALFYTPEHLDEVYGKIRDYEKEELGIRSFFGLLDCVNGLSNNPEDLRRFFHSYDGRMIRHDKVHNLYGFYMTRAAAEAFARRGIADQTMLFSRSSFIGMHRCSGLWTGDNSAFFSHILLNMQQMASLSMTGFLFAGADIGGFGGDTTGDLVLRWTEFGIFTPLFRNHAAHNTRDQEFFRFPFTEAFKNMTDLRYALIPYLFRVFTDAAEHDGLYMQPLSFLWPDDPRARGTEDQIMLGTDLMLAPVYTQNARGRFVYLPEEMKCLRLRSISDFDEEILPAGDHWVRAELAEVLIFMRKGTKLPLHQAGRHVSEITDEIIHTFCF